MSDGAEHIQAAEKALATSFFKRKPDWDEAASRFEMAAKAFQFNKRFREACDAFIRASDAHYHNEVYFLAGKCLESAAGLQAKELKEPRQAAQLYAKSARIFLDNNNGDRAIEQLERAAKAVENDAPEEAIPLYAQACEWYVDQDRQRLGVETYKKLIALLLKLGRADDALKWTDKLTDLLSAIQSKHLLSKNHMSAIVLLLAAGDQVAAAKRFEQYTASDSFHASDEGQITRDVLDAYDKGDEEMLQTALKRPQVNYLDNEIVKVARKLHVPGGMSSVAHPATYNPEVSTLLCDDPGMDKALPAPPPEETDELC